MQPHFEAPSGSGSVIGLVATDAPLLPDQCRSLARRMVLGIGRISATGSHFSGDLFLAVSVASRGTFATFAHSFSRRAAPYGKLRFVLWVAVDPIFDAVVRA